MGRGHRGRARRGAPLPFRVAGEPGGVVRIGLGDREFTPPEISAFILRELKRRAEDVLPASRASSTSRWTARSSPCRPTSTTRSARRRATPGRIAGLEVLRIINEPTAASLAYGLDQRERRARSPSTTSAAARSTSRSCAWRTASSRCSRPTATRTSAATTSTCCSSRWCSDEIGVGREPRRPSCVQAIRQAVIQAKWDLSEQRRDRDPRGRAWRGGRGDCRTGARSRAPSSSGSSRRSSSARSRRAGRRSPTPGLTPSQIDEVVLVGGSTRIPLVRRVGRGAVRPHAAQPS